MTGLPLKTRFPKIQEKWEARCQKVTLHTILIPQVTLLRHPAILAEIAPEILLLSAALRTSKVGGRKAANRHHSALPSVRQAFPGPQGDQLW